VCAGLRVAVLCSSYKLDVTLSKENLVLFRQCHFFNALYFGLRCVYRENVVFTGLVLWWWCVRPFNRVEISYCGFWGLKREANILFGNIVCSSFRWFCLIYLA
jgi:hypothetical protein